MRNYVADGSPLTITAGATYTSGTPVLVGGLLVVPQCDAASGAVVSVVTEGVVTIAKVSAAILLSVHTAAEAITLGQALYWDDANSKVTGKAVGKRIGTAAAAAADTATTVDVLLAGIGSDAPGMKVAIGYYDFGQQGGATGAITLYGGTIPAGCLPTHQEHKVTQTFTSATDAATIALGTADGADALKAAIAISNGANTWDAGTFIAAANALTVTTAARPLTMTIAVEAVTAGKMYVAAFYLDSGLG